MSLFALQGKEISLGSSWDHEWFVANRMLIMCNMHFSWRNVCVDNAFDNLVIYGSRKQLASAYEITHGMEGIISGVQHKLT